MKKHLRRRLANRIRKAYWSVIGHLNRKAYLRHAVGDPDDWESREELLCIETTEFPDVAQRSTPG